MTKQEVEKLWREEKYAVMFHSQKHYNAIREQMRYGATFQEIQQLIVDAHSHTPTEGSMRNALQHMWGYFRKIATPVEKEQYETFLQENNVASLLTFLRQLAYKYHVRYLQESTILA